MVPLVFPGKHNRTLMVNTTAIGLPRFRCSSTLPSLKTDDHKLLSLRFLFLLLTGVEAAAQSLLLAGTEKDLWHQDFNVRGSSDIVPQGTWKVLIVEQIVGRKPALPAANRHVRCGCDSIGKINFLTISLGSILLAFINILVFMRLGPSIERRKSFLIAQVFIIPGAKRFSKMKSHDWICASQKTVSLFTRPYETLPSVSGRRNEGEREREREGEGKNTGQDSKSSGNSSRRLVGNDTRFARHNGLD